MNLARPALAACAAAVAFGGCGGGHAQHATVGRQPSGGEEAEGDAAASALPAADRVAYYQLATTTGILRAQAAPARRGRNADEGDALRAGRFRLATLRPHDATLRRLRASLASAVDAFVRAAPGSARRAAAAAALAAAARIENGLRRYLARHRAAAGLVPD